MTTLFTIGYEGLAIESFLALIRENNIDTIVDVRELPLSRKPGFSKKALANHLTAAGFEYVHMVKLGCPKAVRNAYKEDEDWNRYTSGFAEHLRTQDESIQRLIALASASNCALLCYEADYNYCHRNMVATAASKMSELDVRHLQYNKNLNTQ